MITVWRRALSHEHTSDKPKAFDRVTQLRRLSGSESDGLSCLEFFSVNKIAGSLVVNANSQTFTSIYL